jgi:hypothetical protein
MPMPTDPETVLGLCQRYGRLSRQGEKVVEDIVGMMWRHGPEDLRDVHNFLKILRSFAATENAARATPKTGFRSRPSSWLNWPGCIGRIRQGARPPRPTIVKPVSQNRPAGTDMVFRGDPLLGIPLTPAA